MSHTLDTPSLCHAVTQLVLDLKNVYNFKSSTRNVIKFES